MKQLLMIFLLGMVCIFANTGYAQPKDSVEFDFLMRRPSLEALDSYPQTVAGISKEGDLYRIHLKTRNAYRDTAMLAEFRRAPRVAAQPYDVSVARYLQPTLLIPSAEVRIRAIADTLFDPSDNLIETVKKALAFVHGYLRYDDSLAREIDAGRCRTLDVGTVLDRQKGTCSEYTNLFIALMRYAGVPTRFAVGYIYIPEQNMTGTHAWAECYVPDAGWWAVDPQGEGSSSVFPHVKAIKMRHGLDFDDCRIGDLNADIQPVEITVVR